MLADALTALGQAATDGFIKSYTNFGALAKPACRMSGRSCSLACGWAQKSLRYITTAPFGGWKMPDRRK
ncbi:MULTISPECIES: hypothetical protein [Mesorhizobium]|uniref:hypothetical protein n=1 Tax=Mesorhizobium TaxID=68287 RepID=UPI001010D13D|nr:MULTISPECIES: hypothetical protein [Mesorhizobium]